MFILIFLFTIKRKKKLSKIYKISIVMAYYNRKNQTIETLKRFQKLYAGKYNFEVVLIDDNSNEEHRLEEDIKQFTFPINLIIISKEEKGDVINPCKAYNRGFAESKGQIIMIQNPEIYHCGDIIEYVLSNLNMIKNNYITFPVFSSPSFQHNKILYNIENNYHQNFVKKINYRDYGFNYEYYINKYPEFKNMNYKQAEDNYLKEGIIQGKKCNETNIFFRKNVIDWNGWYNHFKYNPRNLHFLSVITREKLNTIGGFCSDFKYGLWYDDNDFLYRIQKNTNVITLKSEYYFGIHQYHIDGSDIQHNLNNFKELINNNKCIFDYNIKNNIIYCNPFKIGLCFKIYVNEKTKLERYEIIEDFLNSLQETFKNNKELEIIGVIDCKINDYLKRILDKIDTKKINLIYLNDNYGISHSTNKGIINLVEKKCDYIFCSDDDIIFKSKDIFDNYIRCSLKHNIHHLGYYPVNQKNISSNEFNKNYETIDDIMVINNGYCGCFYMVRSHDIINRGLLPILNSKYGYEHEIFTKTLTGKQYDLVESHKFINLNIKSLNVCSGSKIDKNNWNHKSKDYKLIPYIKMKQDIL